MCRCQRRFSVLVLVFVFTRFLVPFCLFSFETTLTRTRGLVALLLLSSLYIATVSALWLFLTVAWVDLHRLMMVFLDGTHLLFSHRTYSKFI